MQVGGGVVCVSKLLLEALLVADHHLLPSGLQQADERVDHVQSSTAERNQNQNLTRWTETDQSS